MRKKIFSLLAVAFICVFSSNAYAMDLGKLEKVEDKLIPDGKNAIISQKITAVTNDKGEVAFPSYEDSEILKVEAATGNIVQSPKVDKYGDKSYNVIVFDEKNSEVNFEVSIRQEDIYEGEEADLGDTFPGGALEIKYEAVNTSPNDIKSYSARIAVPQGKELLNIVDYNPKKAFNIAEEDGYVFGEYHFKGIDAGEEAELAINIYSPKKTRIIAVWIGAIIISMAFMAKNKHLLSKA